MTKKITFKKQAENKLKELREKRKDRQAWKKKLEENLQRTEKEINEYEGAIIVLHELVTGEKVE